MSVGLIVYAVVLGLLATLLADAWSALLKCLGITGLNYAMLGRWLGHMCRAKFVHVSIAEASPVAHELVLGWVLHYLTGIAFAGLFLIWCGPSWLTQDLLLPAFSLGLLTVVLPFFVMQPAMGSGWAAARTATPWRNRLRSLSYHAAFGGGLYLSGRLLQFVLR